MRVPALVMKCSIGLAAAAAMAIFLHWMATQPAFKPPAREGTPLFVQLVVGSDQMKPPAPAWYTTATLASTAITGIAASGLALLILLRTALTPATRRLAASLALGSLSAAYFFFVLVFPQYRELLRLAASPAWKFVLDFAAYMAAFAAAYDLMRFFHAYPREPTEEEWLAHYRKHVDDLAARLDTGWRRWVYPKRLILYATRSQRAGWHQRLIDSSPGARAMVRRLFMSRWPLVFLAAVALAAAAIDGFAFDLAPWAFSFGTLAVVYMIAVAYEALQYHHHEAVAADRAKIDWIYGSMLVFGLFAISLAPLWWAATLVVVPQLEAGSIMLSPGLMVAGPSVLGLQLFLLAFVASLALSIFYRGAVDPRLAARRITFFGLMSIVITCLFVFLERAVASKIVVWLGSPPETGILMAGAIVAATFSPIRVRTEKAANIFIARFLPLDSLMEGERKVVAVVLSDLSGYTALSDHDEKQALLLAALLQRQAHMLADECDGRVVKSMGDAVVMTFHDALSATKALATLHARFGESAKALGLTPLEVHSGAHIGEVTQTSDGDIYGQTVNIAARLQSLAKPGQRVVSETLANSARVEEPGRRSLGVHRLKNVAEPMSCVELISSS